MLVKKVINAAIMIAVICTMATSPADAGISYEENEQIKNRIVVDYKTENKTPIIILLGENPMIIKRGSVFVDKGAIAGDNNQNSGRIAVHTTGHVNTNKRGIYVIKYSATSNSHTTTRHRIVFVQ